MQEAVAGAQRRSRARTCSAVLELWNELLDRKVLKVTLAHSALKAQLGLQVTKALKVVKAL